MKKRTLIWGMAVVLGAAEVLADPASTTQMPVTATSGTAAYALISGSATTTGTAIYALVSGSAATSGTAGAITVGRKNVVFEGDSITAWGTWPSLLLTGSAGPAFAQCTGTNVATAGDTLANLYSEYLAQVQPLEPNTTGTAGILFVRIGTNDLSQAHFATYASAAAYVTGTGNSLLNYWRKAQAGGYKVVGFTVNDFAGNDNDAVRRQVNRLIRDAAAQNNVPLIDTDALIPDHSTSYFADGTHPTVLQDQLVARYINNFFSTNEPVVFPSGSDYATRNDANVTFFGYTTLSGTTLFSGPFSVVGGISLTGSAQNMPQAIFGGPIETNANWGGPITIGIVNGNNNLGLNFGSQYKLEITGTQGTIFDDPATFQKPVITTGSVGLRVMGGQDFSGGFPQNTPQAIFDGPIETNGNWGGPVTIGII